MDKNNLHQKEAILFLSISSILALVLLGSNLAGYAVYNEAVKPLCSNDDDCNQNESCCLFYQKESGVCHSAEYCHSIEELTQNEFLKSPYAKKIEIEYPMKNNNSTIILGTSTLLILLTLILLILKPQKKTKPKRKNKK